MTGRIKRTLHNGKDRLSSMQSSVSESTRRAARKTDYYVHDNAWKLMGAVAGLAFAAGFLLSRRNQEALAFEYQPETPRQEEKLQKMNSWEFVHSAIPLALFFWKAMQASRCARKGAV